MSTTPPSDPSTAAPVETPAAATAEQEYAERLERLQGKRWKKLLNVQLPWKLHLARLEGRVTLRVLLELMPEIRLDGAVERIEPFLLWGRRQLPVRWA